MKLSISYHFVEQTSRPDVHCNMLEFPHFKKRKRVFIMIVVLPKTLGLHLAENSKRQIAGHVNQFEVIAKKNVSQLLPNTGKCT